MSAPSPAGAGAAGAAMGEEGPREDGLMRFLGQQLLEACSSLSGARVAELLQAISSHSADAAAGSPRAGRQDSGSPPERPLLAQARGRTHRLGAALAQELRASPEAPGWVLAGGEGEIRAGLADLEARKEAKQRAFQDIKGVHEALQRRGETVPTAKELHAYSAAASIVGAKAWSKDTARWVLGELGVAGPASDSACSAGPALRLLDVGSSFGPFCGQPGVDCVALDLAPGTTEVWKADFLQLPILDDIGSDIRAQPVDAACAGGDASASGPAGRGDLLAVGSRSFDAVVMSLVLSFLPTPGFRREMLDRARRCLRPSGSLFVIEKAALSARHAEGRMQLQAFQDALEAAGFATRSYAALGLLDGGKKPHAHAWRLLPTAAPRPHEGPSLRGDVTSEVGRL